MLWITSREQTSVLVTQPDVEVAGHAPEVAILRWNRSTAGTTAPIWSRTPEEEQDRPPVQRSTLPPRPANGRESARHLEATSRDAGEDDAV